ncbi:MAG: phenylalanine--tRNA ligase subunit alpha, partial [Candidatus Omnitrophica bacterium]|nr:phenylalanine--tRNA ligase subunit alpha [Candidatus Omnitrophota bacterium]
IQFLRNIGSLPAKERAEAGSEANEVKRQLEAEYDNWRLELEGRTSALPKDFDISLPGIKPELGHLHPLTQTVQDITDIFERLNFEVVEGREVETEFYNFTALNIPLDHPSRDAFDTFYTEGGNVLRSQTSTVQIRVMEERKPPLRIIAPGRVYRPDEMDASHSFMFHQIEGLMVDETTTFSDLKGVIHLFLKELFGARTEVRFRPHFFPFTEPSAEVDVRCFICGGKGCSVCGRKGWLEVMGCGCVDPAVFDNTNKKTGTKNYDPKRYQGFAFGLGVERICMLRYNIHDIRLFFENDLRFLRQF